MDGGCYGAGFELVQDGCSGRSLDFDRRTVVAAVGRRRRESVAADAVETGVSSGQILVDSAGTPETPLLDGAGAVARSSHLVEQKTWE